MRAQFEREGGIENAWTGYNPSMGRSLLNSAKFLDPRNAEPKKPAAVTDDLDVGILPDDKLKF